MADSTSQTGGIYLHDFPVDLNTETFFSCSYDDIHFEGLASLHGYQAQRGWTRSQRLELCHRWQHPDSDVQQSARNRATEQLLIFLSMTTPWTRCMRP